MLRVAHGRLLAAPPPALAGLIEVRGSGLAHLPHLAAARIHLHVALVDREERMPDPAATRFETTEPPPRHAEVPPSRHVEVPRIALARIGHGASTSAVAMVEHCLALVDAHDAADRAGHAETDTRAEGRTHAGRPHET